MPNKTIQKAAEKLEVKKEPDLKLVSKQEMAVMVNPMTPLAKHAKKVETEEIDE